ncbi:hypothetical protein K7X08_010858 [Anisodus acutangulus]|uniref:C2H2-type domain-containing protein n=2 Tax=Anisodus TaxID=243963 RepID=A0A9Q1LXN9_9SOLA|nr:hypothetical protein K7X08_010858 [Anisodus acutangulus]KAK4357057.1 hypothetical protein RND71_022667 [Anisodus tanguticus]
MASEKNNNYSDSSSEDTTDRELGKFNDDNTGVGRSYECNFCKRGFTNAQALGGHMNIHRKDKLKAKQNNSHHQEFSSTKLSQEANYAYDNSRYYAPSSHDEQPHNFSTSRAQVSYQFYYQLPQNPSYQHVYDHHDDSRPRHDNYYDANNLSLRIEPTLIDNDDEGGKKDVDDSELDLELRLGYNNH